MMTVVTMTMDSNDNAFSADNDVAMQTIRSGDQARVKANTSPLPPAYKSPTSECSGFLHSCLTQD